VSFKHVLSLGLADPRQCGHADGPAMEAPSHQASHGAAGDSGRGRRRFSLGRGRAGRGLVLLAVATVAGLSGVLAGTAAPAEAGPITVTLSASPTFLLAGEATTLTATVSAPVAAPFEIYIFDATTGSMLTCQTTTSETCTTTDDQPVATTHAFVAYVAGAGSTDTNPPSTIVAATSPSVSVTWEAVHRIP
jgi:hypothetical protein